MPAPATPTSGSTSGNGSAYMTQSGFDLNQVGNYTDTLVLTNQITSSVQITAESGAYSAFQGALQGSLDGVEWQDVTAKTGLVMGISAGTGVVDIYKFLRVIVTTPNGAALTARVTILAKTTP